MRSVAGKGSWDAPPVLSIEQGSGVDSSGARDHSVRRQWLSNAAAVKRTGETSLAVWHYQDLASDGEPPAAALLARGGARGRTRGAKDRPCALRGDPGA